MEKPNEGRTTEAIDVVHDPALALRAYRLVVVEGGNVGAELAFDVNAPQRLLIGSSNACQLVLTDRMISRRHVAVDLHGGGVKVVDVGSKNGTRVNGVTVFEAMLEPGDRLKIGTTTLRLDVADAPNEPTVSPSANFGRVLGASVAMRRLYPLCDRLALSDLPVVIEGETGVGKELLAEALHESGPRRSKPFVVFDCAGVRGDAAIPLLFGAGEGGEPSVLEQAHTGTLLLDEISELSDEAQARLMRFADRGEVRRDGGKAVEADVRIIAASRSDLDQAVQAGRFRDELFFRLAVGRIDLPPLREREGDVELLARTFWKALAGQRGPFPPGFLERYAGYRWPGNVRELKNAVVRRIALGAAADLGQTSDVTAEAGDAIEQVLALDLPLIEARARVVNEFEKRYLAKVLEQHGGNVSRAAAASGIARRYFQVLRARMAAAKKA